MTLSQIHFILAVAQHKSFSKAARTCNVTQPTLSNGISKVEEELQQAIFLRSTRSVTLTQFWESILPSVRSMIEIEKSVHSKAKEFLNPKNVVLQVGISPLVNTKFLILLVSAFKANYKDHEVILVEQDLKKLQEKLVSGELDLIITPKVSKTAIGNALSIYKEQLYLIDPADRDSSKVEIGDIRDKTFVMVPDSCGLSEITRSILRSTSRDFKEYEGKAMTYQVLVDWSANGLGCAILPKSKIPEGIKKTLITKRSKPIAIVFEAKWQSSQKKIKSFVKHLKTNSEKIYSGLV